MDSIVLIVVAYGVGLASFALVQRRLLVRLIAAEHQLAVYQRQVKRPRLRDRDRLVWVLLSKLWSGWRKHLRIVQPATVLGWSKRRIRDWWRRRSQPGPGRPPIPQDHIALIRRISRDHPEYGEDTIANELKHKLGVEHAHSTIRKYMVTPKGDDRRASSQAWSTFLKNQASAIWTCDLFVEHTVGLRVVYVLVIMHLGSRKVVHINTTEHPTLPWIQQQVRNALYDADAPRFLLHDNDGKFGQFGRVRRIERDGKARSCRSAFAVWLWQAMGIEGIAIPYGAPNAQAHIERLIGTLRRSCLDHFLIWNERHLTKVLSEFCRWYNAGRVHQGTDAIPDPDPAIEDALVANANAPVMAIPILGGLHHDYRRAA